MIPPLQDYPQHLAEKYAGIPFVYLDVPKVVVDDHFLETFNTLARPVLRLAKTNGYPFTREEAEIKSQQETWFANEYEESGCNWKGVFLTPPVDKTMQHVFLDINYYFPKLKQQILEYFPLKSIKTIRCWENLKQIGLHRDLLDQYPFPTSLRVMLHDENPQPTFWMYPMPEEKLGWGYERMRVDDQSKIVEVDPWRQDSNSFLFNNRDWCHAAKKDDNYSKILMFVEGEWDWQRLEVLLDRSVERYLTKNV